MRALRPIRQPPPSAKIRAWFRLAVVDPKSSDKAGMEDHLPDEIARTVLAAYAALAKNGKPRQLSPSQHSWTVLAAFCLIHRPATGTGAITCVSIG